MSNHACTVFHLSAESSKGVIHPDSLCHLKNLFFPGFFCENVPTKQSNNSGLPPVSQNELCGELKSKEQSVF